MSETKEVKQVHPDHPVGRLAIFCARLVLDRNPAAVFQTGDRCGGDFGNRGLLRLKPGAVMVR